MLPCPSPILRAYSNSCLLHQSSHSTMSSCVVPLSFHLQSFPASGSYQWVDSSHQMAKVLEFQYWNFSISLSNEYSGLISFRMDCLDLLAVQGTLKSLLQHHTSKASILQCSAFFTVQLSHPSSPITSWQIEGGKEEAAADFIFLAPKSLQMVIAAVKLKDACSLEEKLWPTLTAY